MLAHRSRALSVQMIAHVFAAALVAHEHLVSAPAAPDDAVQQHVAVARGSPGLVAHVFGSIVAEDATDLLVCGPIDIGRITILHDEAPLLHRPRSLHRSTGSACNRASLPTPIDEGAGISGFFRIAMTADTLARVHRRSPCRSRRGRSRP